MSDPIRLAATCLLLSVGCTAALPEPATPTPAPAPTRCLGLDVADGLTPFELSCGAEPPESPEVAAREAGRVLDEANLEVDEGRWDAATRSLERAYCVMREHPARGTNLLHLAQAHMVRGHYRAAYEVLLEAADAGARFQDGMGTYREGYLRAVLAEAADRLERDEPPFAICGSTRRGPPCESEERCLRDYARFHMGLCPGRTQMDQDCPGVCVSEANVSEHMD